MDLVGNLDLLAEEDEPIAVRPFAEDQEMGVVANHLQQIGRPDGVLAAAIRLQAAGPTDQTDRFRQAEAIEDLPSRGDAGRRPAGAAGNDLNLLGGHALLDAIVAECREGGHDRAGPSARIAVDRRRERPAMNWNSRDTATRRFTPQQRAAAAA